MPDLIQRLSPVTSLKPCFGVGRFYDVRSKKAGKAIISFSSQDKNAIVALLSLY